MNWTDSDDKFAKIAKIKLGGPPDDVKPSGTPTPDQCGSGPGIIPILDPQTRLIKGWIVSESHYQHLISSRAASKHELAAREEDLSELGEELSKKHDLVAVYRALSAVSTLLVIALVLSRDAMLDLICILAACIFVVALLGLRPWMGKR